MYKPESGHEEASDKPQMRDNFIFFKGVCVLGVGVGVIFFRTVNDIKKQKNEKEGKEGGREEGRKGGGEGQKKERDGGERKRDRKEEREKG